MIANQLGEENFRKGLNIYLKRHQYKNAVTEDLWKALSEASQFDVTGFMDKYTKTTGYPLVYVQPTDTPNKFKVSQHRFFSSGKIQKEEESQTWWVSLNVRVAGSDSITRVDLKKSEETLEFPVTSNTKWFNVNANESGFFRVRYSPELISKLSEGIKSMDVPATERIGLQNDAFALSQAGILPLTEALTLAQAYVNEEDYTVWKDLSEQFSDVETFWDGDPAYPQLKKFIRKIFSTIGSKLGWDEKEGEEDMKKLLRKVVVEKLCKNDDESYVEEAKKRFADHISGKSNIPTDLRGVVYNTVVKNGGVTEYEQVLKIYREADMHEEKLRALRALGESRDSDLILRTLKYSTSSEVREQDIFYVVISTASHSVGREITWNYVRENWSDFKGILEDTAMLIDRFVKIVTEKFASEEKAKEIEEFFKKNPVAPAVRTIRQSIEKCLSHAKWLKNNRDQVATWLQAHI